MEEEPSIRLYGMIMNSIMAMSSEVPTVEILGVLTTVEHAIVDMAGKSVEVVQ